MSVTLAIATLALAGGVTIPASDPVVCLSAPDALEAVDRREALPLAQAWRLALDEQRGEVVMARLCVVSGTLVYFVSVLEKGGHVTRVSIDAATGTLKRLD